VDPQVLLALRCPVCRGRLNREVAVLRCPAGHAFDVARQGYVDLTAGRVTHGGDSAEMVQARQEVLRAGHFDFLTDALLTALPPYPGGLVVDVGAGTGHHLAALLGARPGLRGVAIDVSKAALRRAARAHPRLAAIRADAWSGLPLADGVAGAVLNVFAPRHGAEFARVLRPDGRLIVVTPTAEHLRELALPVRVDPAKEQRLAATLGAWFVRDNDRRLTATLRLSRAEAAAVAAMGPSARHAPASARADTPDRVSATAAVRLTTWRLRPERTEGSAWG
jgi:23S rRNA (guanine745-N1)-methyltransferase